MSNTIYDEIISFSKELVELLNEDWIKFKIFIKKNKKYCFWVICLLITMQFTDIMNLGASWDRYCKNNNHIQLGGGNGIPDGIPTEQKTPAESKAKDKASKKEAKAAAKAAKPPKSGNPLKNNPVFGNINKIFGMTSGMFVIISFILIVVGILSLPILVLIIITYCIIKYILNSLMML